MKNFFLVRTLLCTCLITGFSFVSKADNKIENTNENKDYSCYENRQGIPTHFFVKSNTFECADGSTITVGITIIAVDDNGYTSASTVNYPIHDSCPEGVE